MSKRFFMQRPVQVQYKFEDAQYIVSTFFFTFCFYLTVTYELYELTY